MKEDIPGRLAKVLKLLDLNYPETAVTLGQEVDHIKNVMTRRTKPSTSLLAAAVEIFRVNGSWLLTGEGGDDAMFLPASITGSDRAPQSTNEERAPYGSLTTYPELMVAVVDSVDRQTKDLGLHLSATQRAYVLVKVHATLMSALGDEKLLERLHERQPEAIVDAARLVLRSMPDAAGAFAGQSVIRNEGDR